MNHVQDLLLQFVTPKASRTYTQGKLPEKGREGCDGRGKVVPLHRFRVKGRIFVHAHGERGHLRRNEKGEELQE